MLLCTGVGAKAVVFVLIVVGFMNFCAVVVGGMICAVVVGGVVCADVVGGVVCAVVVGGVVCAVVVGGVVVVTTDFVFNSTALFESA